MFCVVKLFLKKSVRGFYNDSGMNVPLFVVQKSMCQCVSVCP